jgi:hypothetical protein
VQSSPSSRQGDLPVTQKCGGQLIGDYIQCEQQFQIETIDDKCYVRTTQGEPLQGVLGPPKSV